MEKPLEVPEFNLLHKEERARFHLFTHSCVYSTSPLFSTYCVPTNKHRQAVWTEWQLSVPALSVSTLYKVLSRVSLCLSLSLMAPCCDTQPPLQGSGTQMLGSSLPGPLNKREGGGQARPRLSGMGTGLRPGIQ